MIFFFNGPVTQRMELITVLSLWQSVITGPCKELVYVIYVFSSILISTPMLLTSTQLIGNHPNMIV